MTRVGSAGTASIGFTDGMDADAGQRQDDRAPGAVPSAGPVPVAVLLAAGVGSRFAGTGHKLLARLDPTSDRPAESVIERSLAAVADVVGAGDLSAVVVVTGAADIDDEIRRIADEFGVGDRIHVAPNPRFADGQATSVLIGLAAVDRLGARIGVVGLADQPDVAPATWKAVARASARPDATPITVASYDGRPRNPVALDRSIWDRLPTDGDRGARDLIRLHPERVTPVPSLGSPADIDTVEDLRRWQST